MSGLTDSKEIFAQLADVDGSSGVKTLIETHDAWVHNGAVMGAVTAAVRAQVARGRRAQGVARRIAGQRERLAGLVVRAGEAGKLAG